MMANIYKKIIIITFMIIAVGIFIIWQNNDIVKTEIEYVSSKLPMEFNGYRVAHISDLHNKKFGRNQNRLLENIKSLYPDIIVVTGDLIDRRRYDLETSMVFINKAVEIAPVYYVSGNHEAWSGEYENIKESLLKAGVEVLDDKKIEITRGKSKLEIVGLSDPAFLASSHREEVDISNIEGKLERLSSGSSFQILLSHRPENFNLYAEKDMDITFSGHAHGGQFRIPFLGGLVAPNQGIFPEYTSGIHTIETSSLVVSRGLGNSIIPIRIFNRPEVVLVSLKSK